MLSLNYWNTTDPNCVPKGYAWGTYVDDATSLRVEGKEAYTIEPWNLTENLIDSTLISNETKMWAYLLKDNTTARTFSIVKWAYLDYNMLRGIPSTYETKIHVLDNSSLVNGTDPCK
jgi:hypothetical protein